MSSRLVLVIGDFHIPDRAIDIPAKFKKLLTPGKIGQILCLGNLTSPSVYAFLRSLAPDLQLVKGDFDLPLTNLPPPPPPPQHQSSHQALPHDAASSSANLTAGAAPAPASYPIPTALSKVVTHGHLRIGFTHGDTILPPGDPDALLIAARQMDVDVLCWGGTCKFEAYEMENKFFVNPGSATGAASWNDEEVQPLTTTASSEGADENGNAAAAADGFDDGEGNTPSFVLMDVQGDVLVLYVYQLKRDAAGAQTVAVEKVSFRKSASAAVAGAGA